MSTTSLAEKAFRRVSSQCARSEQCESEVRTRVMRWGLSDDQASEVIAMLKREGYIDEQRYANAFVHDRWNYNRWGRLKISYTLRVKKIPQEMVDIALQTITPEEYEAVLTDLLRAKLPTVADREPRKQRAALHQFASGKGFEMQVILPVLNSLFANDD